MMQASTFWRKKEIYDYIRLVTGRYYMYHNATSQLAQINSKQEFNIFILRVMYEILYE